MKPMQVGGLRRAALPEQPCQPRDIADNIDHVIWRIGGDVVTRRRRRNGMPELSRHLRDIADDVHMAVVVDVGGPSVRAAVSERICANGVLDASAEAIAVGIVRRDGPGRQILGRVIPTGTVVSAA